MRIDRQRAFAERGQQMALPGIPELYPVAHRDDRLTVWCDHDPRAIQRRNDREGGDSPAAAGIVQRDTASGRHDDAGAGGIYPGVGRSVGVCGSGTRREP